MDRRLGFHYFQDINHYQSRDLALWLPELKALNAGWMVLKSPATMAIPEEFIASLVSQGINPIIDFDLQVNTQVRPEELRVILAAYAKWGVKYVVFFRSPNTKAAWVDGTWSNGDLVERFLDRYVPFMRMAEQNGLVSVFPPLQPGGDYWDLSFLKKLFQLVQQRRSLDFGSNLHMAVSAQTFSRPLSWGAGGPLQWKMPRPYTKNEIGEEDHIGINTWEWYHHLVKSTLNISPKLFLFWFGASSIYQNTLDPSLTFDSLYEQFNSARDNRAADSILGCLFWVLASPSGDPRENTSWFDDQGKPKQPSIAAYKEKLEHTRKQEVEYPVAGKVAEWMYPIDHYLLLPSYEWGVPENTLDRVRPILRDSRPTIGFSLIEALNARKVTVWNENAAFSEKDIDMLRQAGCLIDEQVVTSIGVDR